MIRSRILNIVALLVNIALFILFFVGLYFQLIKGVSIGDIPEYIKSGYLVENIKACFANFAFITGLLTSITSLCMIFIVPKNIRHKQNLTPRFFKTLRYIVACMSCVVIFFSLVVLGPSFSFKEIFITGNAQYRDLILINYSAVIFRLVMPLLSICLFLFVEVEQTRRFRNVIKPFAVILTYGIAMLIVIGALSNKDIKSAAEFSPYYFFLFNDNLINASPYASYLTTTRTISVLVATIVGSFVVGVIMWMVNRLNGALFIGYEYVEVDEANRVVRPLNKISMKDIYKKETVKVIDEHTGTMKKKVKTKMHAKRIGSQYVYHVSIYSHKLGNWKVKSNKAKSSPKIFPTKHEATEYARMLAKKNGGTVNIHSSNKKED